MQCEGYSIGTFERTLKFLLMFMENNSAVLVRGEHIQETSPNPGVGRRFVLQLLCHCSKSSPREQVRLCSK